MVKVFISDWQAVNMFNKKIAFKYISILYINVGAGTLALPKMSSIF